MSEPGKRYWPRTEAEFAALVAKAKARYAPVMARLDFHELYGLNEALSEAFEAMKAEAAQEDIRRGFRPAGSKVGNR